MSEKIVCGWCGCFHDNYEGMYDWMKCLDAVRDSLRKENKALRAENKRIIKLFELLTPGGSEFYNDPDRCYRFAKDSHATMGKVAAERNALRARVAELEKLMLEAMDNCETCRGEAVVSRMCARCQTFFRVTRG